MKTHAHIRPFCEAHVAPANALTNHFIEHTAIHFGAAPATDAAFEALWRKAGVRHPWLAAELDGRFAGYCKAGVWREREAYAATVETGIYVSDHARGQGVGRALYVAMFARLRTLGVHSVVAGISLPNEASVRLHEGVGFKPVGVFHEVGNKFGQWHDVGFWELRLSADGR